MVKAFTLIELLIAMIITCLVVFFAYMFLDSTGLLFNSLKRDSQYINDAFAFVSILTREFDESKNIDFDETEQLILVPRKDVKYFLVNNRIVRNVGSLADTFNTGFIRYEIADTEVTDSVTSKLAINLDEKQYLLNFISSKDIQQQLDENVFLKELRNGRD